MHFSTSQSARPPFRVPRQKQVKKCDDKPEALKLCIQFYELTLLNTTKTYQKLQIHANMFSEEELTSDLPGPQNPVQYGQSSECTLLSNLPFR